MDPLPPRLFWRRGLGFLVDHLRAALLALALLWPFAGNPDRLRLGGFLSSQECAPITPITSITEAAAAVIAPDRPTAALVFVRLGPEQLNLLAQMPLAWFIAAVLPLAVLSLTCDRLALIRWRGTMPWDRWTGRGPVACA